MPNGGVPLHKALFPQEGELVAYCRASQLSIFTTTEWEGNKVNGKPLAVLSAGESAARVGFLVHWLGDRELPPCRPEKGVEVVFDC